MFTSIRSWLAVFFFAAVVSLPFATPAFAANSTLSITNTGDGDTVQISVTGDPNSSVLLYYTKTGIGPFLNFIGTTTSQGTLVTTVSATSYQVSPSTPVHAVINNNNSPDVTWPASTSASNLSLSKTSIILPLGQSTTLNAFNNGSNLLYLSNNTSPQVANVNISGNQITVLGNSFGSTTVTICAQGTTLSCASTYVSVQNTNASPITFSQTNVSIMTGTTVAVNILGGTGSFVLLNNSNTPAIQASMAGTTVNLTANQASGFSAITICSSDMSACGIINANIGAKSSTALTFSQTSPVITVGQNLTLTISGAPSNAVYSIYSNSNTNAVQATLSVNSIKLNGLAAGTSTITVCTSTGSCAAVTVAVNAVLTTSGPITLNQNNVWIAVGQNYGITITGGEPPYSTIGGSANISTSITGNVLTVTGLSSGSATVGVCSGEGGCTTLSILVNGTGTVSPQTATNITLSQSSVTLNGGSTATITLSGSGGYSVASNSNPAAATVAIAGSSATIKGINTGSATVSICQTQGQCAILSIAVTSSTTPATVVVPDWTYCGAEAQTCSFTGTQVVRYGSNGNYAYQTATSSLLCSNDAFGDPSPSAAKTCYFGGKIPDGYIAPILKTISTPTTPGWTTCASEKQSCEFSGTKTIRYGANGKFMTHAFSNGVVCSNAAFGDPIPGTAKTCSYQSGTATETTTAAKTKIKNPISYGMKGTDVTQLQNRLVTLGYYSGAVNGLYNAATVTAVKKYQKRKGIKQTGNVGPATLASLNS